MKYCYVDTLKNSGTLLFFLRDKEEMQILAEPSQYLMHKVREHRSPNTRRKIAYSLAYYIDFIKENDVTVEKVLLMNYEEQYKHFVKFLMWLKAGKHNDLNKTANNNTCNSYLEAVFGFYEYLTLQYEKEGALKVLEQKSRKFISTAGVRCRRNINAFRGYLPKKESVGRTVEEEKIRILIKACDNSRNILLLLLLAETGMRIGEVLGIKYTKDIDFEKRTIRVAYREDNANGARAKNAEIRNAKIRKETLEVLQHYIAEYHSILKDTDYLFINVSGKNKGKPMTANAVYSMLRVLENRTSIKVTPHMLRHYYANERRKDGWGIEYISRALGHKHLATTERYLNIEDEELCSVTDAFYQSTRGLYDFDQLIG